MDHYKDVLPADQRVIPGSLTLNNQPLPENDLFVTGSFINQQPQAQNNPIYLRQLQSQLLNLTHVPKNKAQMWLTHLDFVAKSD